MEPLTASSRRILGIRLEDWMWAVLFAALSIFGTYRNSATVTILILMGALQIVEPNFGFFSSPRGAVLSFALKVSLCFILLDLTGGITSSYYWLLLLPVLSASASFGLLGTMIATAIACGTYLSFVLLLGPGDVIDADQWSELILRLAQWPVVGYLTHQLAAAKRDEARRYQTTAERLAEVNRDLERAQEAATRSERLAALGQLSAGLAHELRNPLGTMKASAELLLKSTAGGSEIERELAGFIFSEVDRANSLITRFLDFARPLALRPEKAALIETIDAAVEEVERHQPPYDVAIYKNYSPDIPRFRFDPELMQRVFYNLLLNAAQASPPKGSVTVKTRLAGDMAEIAVIDRGSGIDRKHLENIFNPFFTTKSQGVGLGLAIVSKIVDEHGGKIAVESEPGAGSVFRVYLPAGEENE